MSNGDTADLVQVGQVRKPHGVQGEVLIEVLSDQPNRFRPGAELIAIARAGERRRLSVASVRPHRGTLLLVFEGIEDRDQVELLRGARLMIPEAEVAEPSNGSYYYFDLIGRSCRDRTSGDLGTVTAVREDGGGLLLEIRDDQRTLLVPFVREYLVSIDAKDQPIEFDLPEGLLEVCAFQ